MSTGKQKNKQDFRGTKGKWLAKLGDEKNTSYVHIGDMTIELEINGKDRIDEEKANALLISKAPEMLEKLKDILWAVENSNIEADVISIEDLEKLIKSATEI